MTYPVLRLSHVASTRTSNVDKKSYDGEANVRLCNYTDVYKNDTITTDMDFMVATATQDQVGKFGLKVGDTVFTKDSETADDIGIPAYIGESAHDLVCGYHLAIARPFGGAADPRFLYWCLASPEAAQQWSVLASGVTRVGLRQADIGKLEIPVPLLQTQRQVAAFLDLETAQIDNLIAKQERLIELLAEKRQAVVTQAVTKGLDPTAPTKPSGIPWLGDIPAHWNVTTVKRLASVISKGTTPTTVGAEFTDEGIRFLKAENIQNNAVMDTPANFISAETNRLLARSELQRDDLLVVIAGATTGKSAVLGLDMTPCNTNQAVAFVRPNDPSMSQWIHHVLTTPSVQNLIGSLSVQSAQPNLSMGDLGSIWLPLPPAPEIDSILSHSAQSSGRLDELMTSAQRAVDLLRERRSALISAAVTGKIDVRKEAS